MIIYPAIDIKDGKCVRLKQGEYDTAEKVAENWILASREFKRAGATWVHMVDLDGALVGKPVNREIFIEVANETDLKVQLGGGIRTLVDIKDYLVQGISRIVLGSVALEDSELVKDAIKLFGKDRIAVSIDAKHEFIKISGWTKESEKHYYDFAKEMIDIGVETIIFTDISKDGMMLGPSLEPLEKLVDLKPENLIASGGISNIEDIKNIKDIGVNGAILGKALYEEKIDLEEAINKFC